MLVWCSDCACRTALRSAGYGSTEARSTSVRAGAVTGMPRRYATSSPSRVVVRWIRMPWWVRGAVPAMLTSGKRSSQATKPHSEAAEKWLSRAPGPQALTAASQRPSSGGFAWPTAYTPR